MSDRELLLAISEIVLDIRLRPARAVLNIIHLLVGAGYLKRRR